MSVIRSKRQESVVEFINTARELCSYSIKQCAKIPKRYRFFISTDIANIANNVLDCVVRTNSIHPTNQHEFQIKHDLIVEAISGCESLVSKITLAEEIVGFDEHTMKEWMRLVSTELRLLRGVKKRNIEQRKAANNVTTQSDEVK